MRYIILIFLLLITIFPQAQNGRSEAYPFLTIPVSARSAGLGGTPTSIVDNDYNLVASNPALLTDTMDMMLILNYAPYIDGVKNSYFAFNKSVKEVGNFSIGMHYINYGNFNGYDEFESSTGNFSARDMAIYMQYSRALSKKITGGITIKPIFSNYAGYTSNGLATDIAFNFHSLNKLFSAGLIYQNLGRQFTNYTNSDTEPIQSNLSLAISQRLAHAPFRFLATYQYINKWDLTYTVPNQGDGTYNPSDYQNTTKNNLLRHFVIGVEFLPSKNFYMDFSYNGKRSQELSIDEKPGLVGFSGGFGFRIKQFSFAYAFSKYHLSSTTNFFSLTTHIGKFVKRR